MLSVIRTALDPKSLDRLRFILRHAEQTSDLERTLDGARSIRWRKPVITRVGTATANHDHSNWTMPITVNRGEVICETGRKRNFEYEIAVRFHDNRGADRARKILQAITRRWDARPGRQTAGR
jgi:hypothetical protein